MRRFKRPSGTRTSVVRRIGSITCGQRRRRFWPDCQAPSGEVQCEISAASFPYGLPKQPVLHFIPTPWLPEFLLAARKEYDELVGIAVGDVVAREVTE